MLLGIPWNDIYGGIPTVNLWQDLLTARGLGCMGRVPAGSQVFIEAIKKPHVLGRKLEIKNIGILEDAFPV